MNRILTEQNLRRIAEASLALAAGACLVLWLVRIFYAISFTTPYMAVTTGGEEETLFSIWKFTQHQPVYTDPHRIPFAASLFNWGFYWFYGSVIKACLHALRLDVVWMATIGRLATVMFALLSGVIFYFAQRDLVKEGLFARPAVRWAWSLIAISSPLVGFWSLTVRSDLGALALECAGFYAILRYARKPSDRLILVAVIFFYAAWAFKQTQVTVLTGSVFSLLLLKRWRAVVILCSGWWTLVILTFRLGGPLYREIVVFGMRNLPLVLQRGVENAGLAMVRNLFLPFGLAAVLWMVSKRVHRVALNPVETAVTAVLLVSIGFAAVTGCKAGAAANYYIPTAWVAMLALAVLWQRIHARFTMAALVVCALVMICGIADAHAAYGAYRYEDSLHRIVAEKLRRLPGPVFASDRYADLPWVQPTSPHFVLAYTYYVDRAAGIPFEGDGWEGLARQGYFGTVVMDYADPSLPALLEKYALTDEYRDGSSDIRFYCRIGSLRDARAAGLPH